LNGFCADIYMEMLKSLKGHPIPRSFPSFHAIQASFISTSHSSQKGIMTSKLYTFLLLFFIVVLYCYTA